MRRSEARLALIAWLDSENQYGYNSDLGSEHIADGILDVLDRALRFEPEIRNFSGTATAVARVK